MYKPKTMAYCYELSGMYKKRVYKLIDADPRTTTQDKLLAELPVHLRQSAVFTECPLYFEHSIRVKFTLKFDEQGNILNRKLTVSPKPAPGWVEMYKFMSSTCLRAAVRRANGPTHPSWVASKFYASEDDIPTNADAFFKTECRYVEGVNSVVIIGMLDVAGVDKSRYRGVAADAVLKELDKVQDNFLKGYQLLQCSRGTSEVKK